MIFPLCLGMACHILTVIILVGIWLCQTKSAMRAPSADQENARRLARIAHDFHMRARIFSFLLSADDYRKLIDFKKACALDAHFEAVPSIKPEACFLACAGRNLKGYSMFPLPVWAPGWIFHDGR